MKLINIFLSVILVISLSTSCGSKGKVTVKKSSGAAIAMAPDTGIAMNCAGCPMAGTGSCDSASTKEGWIALFDGKTTTGWKGYNKTDFPSKNWDIVDGSLHCLGLGKGEMTNTDIITTKKYSNFELVLEWKISKGGNSGIFILAQEIPDVEIYKSSPEMQVLDNENHPDNAAGVNGNHKAGSLYDLLPAVPQNTKTFGEWNQIRIMVYQGKVVYKQNGVNVVEYSLGTEDWKTMVANSKFKDWSWFVNTAKEGYIGLQDHGFEVWFKNIKIREL
jgi:hypothetical protein